MQLDDHGGIRIFFPDSYRSTNEGPPAGSASRGPTGLALPDPSEVDAAIDQLLDGVQLERVDEITLARERGSTLTRSLAAAEQSVSVEVDTKPGESAAILVNKDGTYSWVFASGMAGARRSTRRAMVDDSSTLVFEIPLLEGADPSRGGLFDVGEAAIDWIKAKVLKFAATAAVGVAMRVIERGVEPGLVLVNGDDPDRWTRFTDFSQIALPDDRRARILQSTTTLRATPTRP